MTEDMAPDPGTIRGETILEDGVPVGIRFEDGRGLIWGLGTARGPTWIVRRVAGGLHVDVDAPVGSRPDDMGAFLRVILHIRSVRDREGAEREAFLADALRSTGTVDGAAAAALRRDVMAEVRAALDEVDPFLATLDQDAVTRCVATFVDLPMSAAAYAAQDRTMDPEAPLAVALDAHPDLAVTIVSAFDMDPEGFRDAVAGRTTGSLEDVVRKVLRPGLRSRRAVNHALRAAAAFRDMDRQRHAFIQECMRTHAIDDDPASTAGLLLGALPAAWEPDSEAGWGDFAVCSHVVVAAVSEAVPIDRPRLLNARGDWGDLRRRLAAAAGLLDQVPRLTFRGLHSASFDLDDVLISFNEQVLAPACALAGVAEPARGYRPGLESTHHGSRDDVVMDVAYDVMFAGRSIRRMLETSATWHARNGVMAQAMPTDGSHVSWDAGLPDLVVGDVSVRVLCSRVALAEEGARGPDARGVEGLDHCVGNYAGPCVRGETRILSLSRHVTGGLGARMSTAEVTWDDDLRFSCIQHRGASNDEPNQEAVDALDAYLAMLAADPTLVDAGALSPGSEEEGRLAATGYDWRAPGAWERVRTLWDPFLPHDVRGCTVRDYAALATRSEARPKFWMPDRTHLAVPGNGATP